MRIKYFLMHILAMGCVVLGVIGIFLPLLPTTPFMLAAAGLSVNASPKLHSWLMNHKVIGPPLRNYQENRAVSPHTFLTAMLVLWPTIGVSAILLPVWWVGFILIGIASGVSVFLWRARARYCALPK